jgi:hypothetical protein
MAKVQATNETNNKPGVTWAEGDEDDDIDVTEGDIDQQIEEAEKEDNEQDMAD